jgi:hypothetical protein
MLMPVRPGVTSADQVRESWSGRYTGSRDLNRPAEDPLRGQAGLARAQVSTKTLIGDVSTRLKN